MKRRIFNLAPRIALLLLLGAIINVAVAWGFAALVDVGRLRAVGQAVSSPEGDWYIFRWSRTGAVRLSSFRADAGATHPIVPPLHPSELGSEWKDMFKFPKRTTREVDMRGWPMLSMWFEHIKNDTSEYFGGRILQEHAFEYRAPRVLPLRPLWPGFAINTIFYGAILWMMFAFPFVVRRRRRIKRGLCPACAYPMGTSAICTECGTAFKK